MPDLKTAIATRLKFMICVAVCLLASVTAKRADAPAPTFSLADLLVKARDGNPVMAIARAQLTDYLAQFDRAYYAWTPRLRLDTLLAPLPERRELRQCVSLDTVGAGNGNLAEVFPCPGQDIQVDERITADTEIGILVGAKARLTFPIYTFGKVEYAQEAARAGVELGRTGLDLARSNLDYLVKKAYYGAQFAMSALDILQDGRKRMQKVRRDIEQELEKESGRFTSNDLRQLIVDEADLRARILEVQSLNAQAWAGLRIAAHVDADAPINLDSLNLKAVHVEARDRAEYIELAVAARPDLKIARAAVRAREGQVKMALTDFFPNIALVGQFNFAKGTTADDPADPFANDNYNFLGWGVVLGAEWNIDYSVLVSAHKRARARLAKQRAQYDALFQKVRLDVTGEVEEMKRRQQEMVIRRSAMKAAKGWLVSNTLNFGLGLTKTNELLKSLVAYSRARLETFRSIYEFNLAVARLSQSVGSDLAVPPPE
ncbi:MAG: TolC family protein [Myxococcota bacterium]|nr:TolC family protein [Myxococcota bacterium]